MAYYLLQRGLATIFIVFGVVCLVFMLLHLVPGDPVAVMLGEHARPADYVALQRALGLDQPVHVQFYEYLAGLFQGDLGQSLHTREAVSNILVKRFPATAQLALAALLVALLLAIPLGTAAAVYRDRWIDAAASSFSMVGLSIPNFWLGPIFILLFAILLGWLPVSGREGWQSLVLPALTLGFSMAAILTRMVRSSLLDVLSEDYIRTARAKGLGRVRLVIFHALRNAWLPVLTLIGLQFGALLGGAVITETIFSWPGIGSLLVESIQKRDYPVVQGIVLLISLSYVLVNTLTDLMYARLDPRITMEGD